VSDHTEPPAPGADTETPSTDVLRRSLELHERCPGSPWEPDTGAALIREILRVRAALAAERERREGVETELAAARDHGAHDQHGVCDACDAAERERERAERLEGQLDDYWKRIQTEKGRAERLAAQVKRWEDKEVRRASCCDANEQRAEAAERDAAVMRAALAPFARFVFGPRWYGHEMRERDGDAVVCCGYDAEGRTTGVDVKFSDFERARALASETP
jgi:hypothetical protein